MATHISTANSVPGWTWGTTGSKRWGGASQDVRTGTPPTKQSSVGDPSWGSLSLSLAVNTLIYLRR